MIESSICLKAWMGRYPASNRVLIDGGLHGQTIRLEGDIGRRAVRLSSVVGGASAAQWIGVRFEPSFAGKRVGIDARRAARGVAVDADELAGMPRPAIDFATLKRCKSRVAEDAGAPAFRQACRKRTGSPL